MSDKKVLNWRAAIHTPKLFFFCAVIFFSRCKNFGHFWDSPPEHKANTSASVTYWRTADTGQTQCYDNTTTATCTGNAGSYPNQDADFVDTPRARSFTGPTQHSIYWADYTTVDNVTGLIWKTCTEGKTGATCTGTAGNYTISPDTATPACTALNTANSGVGYAGRTDWRLPTVSELQTLALYSGASIAIDATAFPGAVASSYWSSTSDVYTPANSWFVSYIDGAVSSTAKSTAYQVRCVSPGPLRAAAYTDNGDGTVSDASTGLVWQQCSAGLSGNSCTGTLTPLVWSAALTYCKNLTLAGRSWRMPSANEIMTLADYTATNPAINLTYFPGTPAAENYWTSTTLPGTPANARHFFIQLGILHNMVKSAAIQIRCVANDL